MGLGQWIRRLICVGAVTANLASAHADRYAPEGACASPRSNLYSEFERISWWATAPANQISLMSSQEKTIEELTSIFETGSKSSKCGAISGLDDGQGLNVGSVGLNTKAGVLQEFVKEYLSKLRPPLSSAQEELKEVYWPCLKKIEGTGNYQCLYPDVNFSGMSATQRALALKNMDFGRVWQELSTSRSMKAAQERFVHEKYFEPAMEMAAKAGLQSALGRAFIYDSVIQGGEKGTDKLISRTQALFESEYPGQRSPDGALEEVEWLQLFNSVRTQSLEHDRVDTKSRVRALTLLLNTGNLDLRLPFEVNYYGVFELSSDS